jgi:hypothetical protein
MVVTPKEKKVIENYLEYYHSKFKNGKQEPPFSKISFSNQMKLLYDHLTFIVKE